MLSAAAVFIVMQSGQSGQARYPQHLDFAVPVSLAAPPRACRRWPFLGGTTDTARASPT